MFSQFVQEANLEESYNKNGCINAIPIVIYHDFIVDTNHRYLQDKSYTDVSLFSAYTGTINLLPDWGRE